MKVLIYFFPLLFLSCIQTDTANTQSILAKTEFKNEEKIKSLSFDDVADLKKFDSFIKENNLKKIEESGTLGALYNDFENKVQFFINNGSPIQIQNENAFDYLGKEVTFRGAGDTGFIVSSNIAKPNPAPPQSYVKKMLVFLFYFKDQVKPSMTSHDLYQEIFNGPFNHFYQDISGGNIQHSGVVTGWHLIDRKEEVFYGMPCKVFQNEMKAIAEKENIDINDYDVVTYISSCEMYKSLGGRTTTKPINHFNGGKNHFLIEMAGYPTTFYFNTPSSDEDISGISSILIHERGHNFGLPHSNGLHCKDKIIDSACEMIEYGNIHDRMGSGNYGVYFNAYQLYRGGFREKKDLLFINKDGTYEIDPLMATNNNRKIAAIIKNPITGEDLYMLEQREPTHFDAKLSLPSANNIPQGYLLYSMKVPNFTQVADKPFLLNPNPTGLNWWEDIKNKIFTTNYEDDVEGIKIKFISKNEVTKKLKFKVEFDLDNSICNGESTGIQNSLKSLYVRIPPKQISNNASVLKNSPIQHSDTLDYTSISWTEEEIYRGNLITLLPGDEFEVWAHYKNPKHPRCLFPEVESILFPQLPPFISHDLPNKRPVATNTNSPNLDPNYKINVVQTEGNYLLYKLKIDETSPLNSSGDLTFKFKHLNQSTRAILKKIKIKKGNERKSQYVRETIPAASQEREVAF